MPCEICQRGDAVRKETSPGVESLRLRVSRSFTFLGVFRGVLVEERALCFLRGVRDEDLPFFDATSSSLSGPAASSSSSLLLCSSFFEGTNSSSSSASEFMSCWLSRRFLIRQTVKLRTHERVTGAEIMNRSVTTHSCFLMRVDTNWADFLLELLGVTGSIGEFS